MPTEADTCRNYVVPNLHAAGWTDDQIAEQRTFTAGRILVNGRVAQRGKPKRADYLLYYKPSYPLAVVEAKAEYRSATDGMQQAKSYAQTLGLLFAYATNGVSIVEFDFSTGIEREVDAFPSPPISGAATVRPRGCRKNWKTSCWRPIIAPIKSHATTSKSPSTAPSRRS